MKPLQTGITLSLTVFLFYSLCALVWALWPEPFTNFMNALFHGLDFKKLQTGESYTWGNYLYAAIGMALWAFGIGAFFAWLSNCLTRGGKCG